MRSLFCEHPREKDVVAFRRAELLAVFEENLNILTSSSSKKNDNEIRFISFSDLDICIERDILAE